MSQDEFESAVEDTEVDGAGGDVDLEGMTIAQLRTYANLYRVSFSRDSTKQDIIKAIKHKNRGKTFLKQADGDNRPKPGFVRIKLMRDSSPRARNLPVYVQVNGKTCTIPRGVAVDVPFKIEEVLRHSVHPQVVEDGSLPFNDPKRIKIEELPSYPFEVLDRTPGPDPWPGNEVGKKAFHGPREKFWKMFGHWPRRGELKEAIKEGLITIAPTERVADKELTDSGNLSRTG